MNPRGAELAAALAGFAVFIVLVALAAGQIARGRYGDFTHFYEAAGAVRAGTDVYASGSGGYIYPPLLAFLFQPLTWLSVPAAAGVWLAVNAALLLTGALIAAAEAARRFDVRAWAKPAALVSSLALLLTVDKTRSTLNQGQTDCLLVLGFALGLAWVDRRPLLAGIALGLAANIKYLSLIALPWMLIRRRRTAAAWTVAATVGWALLPAASMGWESNLAALRRAASGLTGAVGGNAGAGAADVHADVWHLSVSVTSAMARLAGPEAGVWLKLGAAGLVAAAVLAAVWTLYRASGWSLPGRIGDGTEGSKVVALEWAGLIVAALSFGPQTTGRHFVLLLPVHAMVGAMLIGPDPAGRKLVLLAGTVLFQLAMVLPPGGDAFERAVEAWRAIGGASWCLLAMYATMLWAGLPDRHRPAKGAAR